MDTFFASNLARIKYMLKKSSAVHYDIDDGYTHPEALPHLQWLVDTVEALSAELDKSKILVNHLQNQVVILDEINDLFYTKRL